MARKSASEIIDSLRNAFGENIPDNYTDILEDISDSVRDIDTANYVDAEKYNNLVNENATLARERDDARAQRDSFREKYINRFYNGYSSPDEKAYIATETPQSQIEQDEEWGNYENLFE